MRPLVAGEVVPVTVEEVGEDLRLDLAVLESRVAVRVALITCFGIFGSESQGSRDRRQT